MKTTTVAISIDETFYLSGVDYQDCYDKMALIGMSRYGHDIVEGYLDENGAFHPRQAIVKHKKRRVKKI